MFGCARKSWSMVGLSKRIEALLKELRCDQSYPPGGFCWFSKCEGVFETKVVQVSQESWFAGLDLLRVEIQHVTNRQIFRWYKNMYKNITQKHTAYGGDCMYIIIYISLCVCVNHIFCVGWGWGKCQGPLPTMLVIVKPLQDPPSSPARMWVRSRQTGRLAQVMRRWAAPYGGPSEARQQCRLPKGCDFLELTYFKMHPT